MREIGEMLSLTTRVRQIHTNVMNRLKKRVDGKTNARSW